VRAGGVYPLIMTSPFAHSTHSSRYLGLNTTRGYERSISGREVALFLALLVLPFALLLLPSLASG
jgi:hypothetical protein